MHSNTSDFRTLAVVTLCAAASIATCTAAAQQTAQEEVTVEATRPRRSATGAEISTVSAKRVVNFADLRLTIPSNVNVLKTRIRDAATSACTELEQKYPVAAEGDTTQKCVDDAVQGAMANAQKAIDAAEDRGPAYDAPPPGIQAREGITVEAVRGGRRSAIGAPIQTVTAKRVVSYADVSLTTASGVKVLESRIRDAATSACAELEQKYPIAAEGDTTEKCIDNAAEGAMVDARKVIDSAKRASR